MPGTKVDAEFIVESKMGLVPASLVQVVWRRYMLITLRGISVGRVNGYLGSIKSFGGWRKSEKGIAKS